MDDNDPGLGSDELNLLRKGGIHELFFEEFAEALYVLDGETGAFIAANQKFIDYIGYTREEVLGGKIKAEDIIVEKEQLHQRLNILTSKSQRLKLLGTEIYQLTLKSKQNEKIKTEVIVSRTVLNDRVISFGQVRKISEFKSNIIELEKEVKLKENYVKIAKQKTDLVLRANLRLMQITERIVKTPEFSKHLETCTDSEQLYDTAVTFLASSVGMVRSRAAARMCWLFGSPPT